MTGRAIVRPPGSGPAGPRRARGARRRCPGCRRSEIVPERVLVEQRLADRRPAPNVRCQSSDPAAAPTRRSRREAARRLERPDRRGQVGRPAAEPDVAEAVDEDDRGLERRRRATARRRQREVGRDSAAIDRRADVRESACPIARWAATGAKMSRPWNVDAMTGSHRSRFSRTRASRDPAERVRPPGSAARCRARRGGRRGPSRIAIGRRSVPTPGSTTATWTPTGRYGSAHQSSNAPSRIAYFRTSWPMSTICASGAMPTITPRQMAARAVAAEVGQERDEGSSHGRMVATRPSPTARARSGDRNAPTRPLAAETGTAPGGGLAPFRCSRMAGGGRAPPRGVFGWATGPRPGRSVRFAVRSPNRPCPLHLAEEEQLVDLA